MPLMTHHAHRLFTRLAGLVLALGLLCTAVAYVLFFRIIETATRDNNRP